MAKHEQLIAYLATLGTLVAIFMASLFAAGHGIEVTEAYGLGTITGGLIGILRIPSHKTVTVDNPPSQPVPTVDEPQ